MPLYSSKFQNLNLANAYEGFAALTPSDTTDLLPPGGLQKICCALFIGGAGNVAVNLNGGGTAVLTGLAAGQIVDVGVSRVLATGTTATGVVALYRPGQR